MLANLALVLTVAAITSVLFRVLRQPAVLGYLLAGLIVGPHTPIPLVADSEHIRTLSEIGVTLVMFAIGLEFRVRRLASVLPNAGVTGAIHIGLMIWMGMLLGRAFGWSTQASLLTGAMVAISSTMIVARTFAELKVTGPVRELALSVLVVQDLAAVLLLALGSAVASGQGADGAALLRSAGRLALVLAAMVAIGVLLIPRAIRFVSHLHSPETLLVASVGVCFACAFVAHALGYSVALGAFVAGTVVAESGLGRRIEHLVGPLRDVFAALFFVSVGMMVDPTALWAHGPAIVALTLLVLVGQTLAVSVGAFLAGNGVRASLQTGMSLAQVGEFSFILAGLGASGSMGGAHLLPVAVAVSVVTTFATPWMVRRSGAVAEWIDRRLPPRIQTFASLYGSWVERMRTTGSADHGRPGRLVRLLVLDATLVAAIVIGASLSMEPAVAWLTTHGVGNATLARAIVVAAAIVLAAPLATGAFRTSRALGSVLATRAFPVPGAGPDASVVARRLLALALQLASLLALSAPLLALTQPFLPPGAGVVLLLAIVVVLGIVLWRGAEPLPDRVRAGVDVLLTTFGAPDEPEAGRPSLELAGATHWLGHLERVTLPRGALAAGRSLADLNLRGRTGATVVAVLREGKRIYPSGHEPLHEGDVLLVAGTRDAVAEACRLMCATSDEDGAGTRIGGADPAA
ncbi:MAG: cation:proton antiporter [Myxococcota bacterium]|nr:cation:proton antiporter [Myxococcota bacterium]MDW8362989.1 cation:proton antiporter [Myxococcales bacterium]